MTFSSPNSASTDFSTSTPGVYTVKVDFSAGSGSDGDESGEIKVVKVEAVNVDAGDPVGAKVNYHIEPTDVVISSATFTAPGKTETKYNFSGDFYFTFNQNDLDWDYETDVTPQPIQLVCNINGFSQTVEITATRIRKQTAQIQELLIAYFIGLGYKQYAHKLQEIFHEVSYSISYSGKTIWCGTSMAALYVNGDYKGAIYDDGIGDTDWAELHKYTYSGGDTPEIGMNISTGLGNPDTLYKDSNSNYWFDVNGATGIATTTALIYHKGGDSVPAATIQNANVDCPIP